jgi:hypothetical protein
MPADFPARVDDGFGQARSMSRLFEAFCVRLAVNEAERISGNHFSIQLFAVRVVEQFLQTLVRADAKVMVAVMTDLLVLFQVLFLVVLAALFAGHEDIFSAHDAI